MISKTIGFRGKLFSDTPTYEQHHPRSIGQFLRWSFDWDHAWPSTQPRWDFVASVETARRVWVERWHVSVCRRSVGFGQLKGPWKDLGLHRSKRTTFTTRLSLDWFKGTFAGFTMAFTGFYHQILGVPATFPSNQSNDTWHEIILLWSVSLYHSGQV